MTFSQDDGYGLKLWSASPLLEILGESFAAQGLPSPEGTLEILQGFLEESLAGPHHEMPR